MPPPVSQFTLPVPNLTLTGVIDILAVGFLIYQALSIVRGTRAAHILLGILMAVLLYVVSLWARLEVLRTLLSYCSLHRSGRNRVVPVGDPAHAGAHRPQALAGERVPPP